MRLDDKRDNHLPQSDIKNKNEVCESPRATLPQKLVRVILRIVLPRIRFSSRFLSKCCLLGKNNLNNNKIDGEYICFYFLSKKYRQTWREFINGKEKRRELSKFRIPTEIKINRDRSRIRNSSPETRKNPIFGVSMLFPHLVKIRRETYIIPR